ncbi:MAG: MobF family relaxase [Janthinobacterium lividum]
MMTFRKLAADSDGKLIRAYFTEHSPEPEPGAELEPGARPDASGRLTAYYTGRDSRASWRPDMAPEVAAALGIDPTKPPKNVELDRLFEARRADTGEKWEAVSKPRKISAYDLTTAPHKSVSLAAEFAASPAEAAAIREAVRRANDDTMRYVAREIGWARKGKNGEEGADPGEVAYASFMHHVARPTLQVRDAKTGITYLAEVPMSGDPHDHIHNSMFNLVVTADGRIGSLDTKRLNDRVHEFGAYFQARLADELRKLGIHTAYDDKEQAVVITAIPQIAVDQYSKGRQQTERNAQAYAKRQGLEWEGLSAERKFGILSAAAVAERRSKGDGRTERQSWRDQAEAIGWTHTTVLEGVVVPTLTATERFDRAYEFAARHLAEEFETAAVIDHAKIRTYAARGLIATGIEEVEDIDRVVQLLEQRGITLRGQATSLIVGEIADRKALEAGVTTMKVRATTAAQVHIEERVASHARRAAADRTDALSVATLKAAIDSSGLNFDREPEHGAAQKAAIYSLGTGGKLGFVTGVAGAGKTTLLKPLVAAWHADTRLDAGGREVIGLSTAWRQADALEGAGIRRTAALAPFLSEAEDGRIALSRNTVLVIDEVSQIGPRSFLRLLELQAKHDLTIKGLGDREQCQSIEAGDTMEIMNRALPQGSIPELLTTVRQETARGREIAGLFRAGNAAEALAMKKEDGTVQLVGGDQDEVVGHIADLYIRRRDALRAARSDLGVTISALTNQDAADISRAVRERLKARGEIGSDERVYAAVDQRGDTYELPVATGDKVRLYRRTWARIDGKAGWIGNNGDVLDVVGQSEKGLRLRDADGRVGEVLWPTLRDDESGRLLLGFGHALTIDSAQGITSGEHINALPRGTAGITAFKAYVAESRHVSQAYTIISEAAIFETVKSKRALGDRAEITPEHLWGQVAEDMSEKPYKSLGIDLVAAIERGQEADVDRFIRTEHRVFTQKAAGRDHGKELRARMREQEVRQALRKHIGPLLAAVERREAAIQELAKAVNAFPVALREKVKEAAAVLAQQREAARVEAATTRGPSPGF